MRPMTVRMLALFGIRRRHPVFKIGTYLIANRMQNHAHTPRSNGVDLTPMIRASERNRAYKQTHRPLTTREALALRGII